MRYDIEKQTFQLALLCRPFSETISLKTGVNKPKKSTMSDDGGNFNTPMPWMNRPAARANDGNLLARIHAISLNNCGVALLQRRLYQAATNHLFEALRTYHRAFLGDYSSGDIEGRRCTVYHLVRNKRIYTSDIQLDDMMVSPTPFSGKICFIMVVTCCCLSCAEMSSFFLFF